MNVKILNGREEKRTSRSASSRPKYFGISSPKTRIRRVDIIRIAYSRRPKIRKRKTELSEAKAIFTTILEIRIVEKNLSGFLRK